MAINLLHAIQKNLGYPELIKIDPNTQQTKDNSKEEDRLNQAAIPAVLIVLYKYTRSDHGAQQVLAASLTNDWMEEMLGDENSNAIAKVTEYAGTTEVVAAERMELVAKQAVGLIRQAEPLTIKDVKDMVAAERNNILAYLPPTMHMGDLLNDNTLDDSTTKMEGPISSLMKMLGGEFSKSEKAKENS